MRLVPFPDAERYHAPSLSEDQWDANVRDQCASELRDHFRGTYVDWTTLTS